MVVNTQFHKFNMFLVGISPDKAPPGRRGDVVGSRVYGRVLGVRNNISSHNTGPTRGANVIPRISYQTLYRLIILDPHGGHLAFPESHTKPYRLLIVAARVVVEVVVVLRGAGVIRTHDGPKSP